VKRREIENKESNMDVSKLKKYKKKNQGVKAEEILLGVKGFNWSVRM